MPASNLAEVLDLSDTSETGEASTYDEVLATKDAKKIIQGFLNSIDRAEKLGLPAMVMAVEHLANHKNSTPLIVLYSKLRKERDQNEHVILAAIVAAYFGKGVIKLAEDKDGKMPFKIKGMDTFTRGQAPRNTWGQIVEAQEAGVSYRSAKFKTILKGMFPKAETADKAEVELQADAIKALTKAVSKAAGAHVDVEVIVQAVREAYRNAV